MTSPDSKSSVISIDNQSPLTTESEPWTPTIVTVEKAAAAKIFFECYYNNATSGQITPRELRRRHLEGALYQDSSICPTTRHALRCQWVKQETDHSRATRVMKADGIRAVKGTFAPASNYEVVKILGKGSFGVVRLVREKGVRAERREVYAMKVIRKSDMLRNSQEGHLRAERDFLVSAEGSRW